MFEGLFVRASSLRQPGARQPGARQPGARQPGARQPETDYLYPRMHVLAVLAGQRQIIVI